MIILLNGNRPGCGKDTTANYLEHRHGFEHLKFTTAIKDEIFELFGIQYPGDLSKDTIQYPRFGGVTYRQMMIMIGETFKRTHSYHYWVDKLFDGDNLADMDNIVISDWGFEYEFNYLKTLTYHTVIPVHIMRLGNKIADSRRDLEWLCDYKLVNADCDLNMLYKQIDRMLEEMNR